MPFELPVENFSRLEEKLERWRSAIWSAASRLVFREFPGLSTAALEMFAESFRAASLPRIFSTDLREIPPVLNEDLLDLYGRSEQILANRFSFFHSTKTFGPEIDWQPEAGTAWNRELHSFDFALDLALTYRISREDRYSRHLRYLIANWIATNPPASGAGWVTEALPRRLRNWILASDLARDDWEANPEFLRLVLRSLALQCAFLAEWSGSYFSAEPASGALKANLWKTRALAILQTLFPESTPAEAAGQHSEAIVKLLGPDAAGNAACLRPLDVLQTAETLLDNVMLESAHATPHAGPAKVALQTVLDSLEALLLPDGTLPLFGAEASLAAESLQNLYATAAVIFAEPRWKAVAGQWGILPHLFLGERGWQTFRELPANSWTPVSRSEPQCGICRLVGNPHAGRSALVASFRRATSVGDHEDCLNFELMIGGQRVVVDSGAYKPPDEAGGEPFARREAHNVLIEGKPLGGTRAKHSRELISLRKLSGDGWAGVSASGQRSCHDRLWALAEPGIWVVLDRLSIRQPAGERLTSLLHFFPTFELHRAEDRVLARSRALAVTVVPFGPVCCAIEFTKGDDPQFPGWYAPEFGTRFPSSVLALEWAAAPGILLCGYALVEGRSEGVRFGKWDANSGSVELWSEEKKFTISFQSGVAGKA